MTYEGDLIVSVFTATAQMPIADATVVLSEKDGAEKYILHGIDITNDDGQVGPMRVVTPERSASESPGAGRAFANMVLSVFHPEYEPILINNVQIFPDTVSTQNVMLRPLNDDPYTRHNIQVFNITPQNL